MMGQLHRAAVEGIVAVVDNDPAVRNSLKFSLETEGFSVRLYAGAGELLKDTSVSDCGCVVVDQSLPTMSGLELIKWLRDRSISIPAILIISQPSAALRQRATNAGVSIVEKPLLGNALVDEIRQVVEQGRASSPR